MIKLAELVGQELNWIQPHMMKGEYELRAGERLAATMRFQGPFGSLATATSADGTWTFNRVGFGRAKVTIRATETQTDLAVFKIHAWTRGGTLELPDGRKYLTHTNFWATRYEFTTEMGDALISYRKIGGYLHASSQIEIHPLARGIPEMPWMALLGWYLTLMMHKDAAVTAAATSG